MSLGYGLVSWLIKNIYSDLDLILFKNSSLIFFKVWLIHNTFLKKDQELVSFQSYEKMLLSTKTYIIFLLVYCLPDLSFFSFHSLTLIISKDLGNTPSLYHKVFIEDPAWKSLHSISTVCWSIHNKCILLINCHPWLNLFINDIFIFHIILYTLLTKVKISLFSISLIY